MERPSHRREMIGKRNYRHECFSIRYNNFLHRPWDTYGENSSRPALFATIYLCSPATTSSTNGGFRDNDYCYTGWRKSKKGNSSKRRCMDRNIDILGEVINKLYVRNEGCEVGYEFLDKPSKKVLINGSKS